MRNLIYALLSLFILTSCSDPDNENQTINTESALFRGNIGPENTNNPYDIAGKLHHDILISYIPLETDFATLSSIIFLTDSIASQDSRFNVLAAGAYSTPAPIIITSFLGNPDAVYSALPPSMSLLAIATTKDFCNDVVSLYATEPDYNVAYTFITSYEDAIITSAFTSEEQEIMLTTASIARYSLWLSSRRKKRKPRDRDWDTLFTALTAGVEGATSSTANAIMLSVATAAAGNQ